MKLDRWLLTGILSSQITSNSSSAVDDADTIDALKRQIQDLDRKVRILERKAEIQKEADTEKAKAAPTVSLGATGFCRMPM